MENFDIIENEALRTSVLPGQAFSMDLCELERLDDRLPLEIMKALLAGESPAVDLPLDGPNALLGSAVLGAATTGEDGPIALGYPVMVLSETQLLPIFLWPVTGIREEEGELRLSFSAQGPELCQSLCQWFSDELAFDVPGLVRQQTDIYGFGKELVLNVANALAVKAGWIGHHDKVSLGRVPALRQRNDMLWSGVLSRWEATGPLLAKATRLAIPEPEQDPANTPAPGAQLPKELPAEPQKPLVSASEEQEEKGVWGFPVTVLPAGPYQASLLRALNKSHFVLAEGASGSGKTYGIAAAAIQGLLQDGTSLAVTNNPASFELIERLFNHAGLSDCLLVIRDEDTGKQALVDALRAMPEALRKRASFDEDAYKRLLRPARQAVRRLEGAHKALYSPLLGNMAWQEATGLYLSSQAEQSRQLLFHRMNTKDFVWDEGEFNRLRTALVENEDFLKPLGTLRHPLNALHADWFSKLSLEESEIQVETTLKRLLDRLVSGNHHLCVLIEDFGESLRQHYSDYAADFRRQSQQIRLDIYDYTRDYGGEFSDAGAFQSAKLRLFGSFSSRLREVRDIREDVVNRFDLLQEEFKKNRYFEHKFSSMRGGSSFEKISESLVEFEASLREWERRIPVLVREEMKRLNQQTIHFDQSLRQKLEMTATEMTQLIAAINDSKLFAEPVKFDNPLFVQKREWLEKLLADFSEIYHSLRDFAPYYAWKRHWLSLDENARKLVETLMLVKPLDWQKAFESWYLHQFLLRHHSPELPSELTQVPDAIGATQALRLLLPGRVTHVTQHRQARALKQLNATNSSVYKSLFGRKNTTQLEGYNVAQIFALAPGTLVESFPIILTTPALAVQIFAEMDRPFDAVLLDDAESLDVPVASLSPLGKRVALFVAPGAGAVAMKTIAGTEPFETVRFEKSYKQDGSSVSPNEYISEGRTRFLQQVANRLSNYMDRNRIVLSTNYEGIPVDILVRPTKAGQKAIAVFCDGFLRDPAPASAEWARTQGYRLHEKGVQVLVTWSHDWWRNEDKALRTLAAAILQQDKNAVEGL